VIARFVERTLTRTLLGLVVSGVAATPAAAQAPPALAEIKRPAFQVRRFDEDWSVLRGVDLSRTDDFWDRLKFIPLNGDGSVYLTLGGQVRERLEYFSQFQFGSSEPEQSDGYLLSRIMLSVDLHVTRHFRLFVEGKSSLATDRDLQGEDSNGFVDEIDLQNAFIDATIPFGERSSLRLRGGRQELLFGAQRLVSPLDWSNVRRTFDGGSGIVKLQDWTVTPFWASLVTVRQYQFNEFSDAKQLFGIYATGPVPGLPIRADLYWLGVNNETATFNDTAGRERRHTLGTRAWGQVKDIGLDFELEAAIQVGTLGDADVLAGMVTANVGYALPLPVPSRVYLNFDYASGDGRAGGDVGTFNQLYPLGHAYLGYMDYIGRQNIISPSAGISVTPLRGLTLSATQYFFWRASDQDAVYNAAGAVLRPGTATDARYIGAELDLLVNYQITRHLLGYVGYSHFFAGEFIDRSGPGRDSDFFYRAVQYTF
jgi:Alginate export